MTPVPHSTPTRVGVLHHVEAGDGAGIPLLLLHQTPRSSDEFAELLPLLGRDRRVLAMDTLGFGASPPLAEHSIEAYADGALALLQALGLERVAVLGHHTGGVVALELAAGAPERVERLVLSSTPWTDAAFRARREGHPPIDLVEVREDGSHLTELWQRRQGFYPAGRADLLTRFVRDALVLGSDVEKGHRAVGAYRMEDRVALLRCPVLLLGASADPYAFPDLQPLADALATAARMGRPAVAVIDGGMVPLMEVHAEEVAVHVTAFLSHDRAGSGVPA